MNLDKLTVKHVDNGLQQWNLAAKLNDIPIALKGSTSYLQKLLGGQPFQSNLGGNLGNIDVSVDGNVTLHEGLDGIDIKTTLKTPDLGTVAKLTRMKLPTVGPIAMSAELSDVDHAFQVDLTGNLADIKLTLKGLIGKALDGKGMKIQYAVEAPNLKTASTIAGTELPDIGPIKASGKASDADGFYLLTLKGAVANLKLDADGRMAQSLDGKGVDMNLALKAPDLEQLGKLGGAGLPPVGPVDFKAKLNDIKGGYRVSGLKAKIGNSDLNGEASVAYQRKPVLIKADLSSTRLDLGAFQKQEPTHKAAPEAKTKAQSAKANPATKKSAKPSAGQASEVASGERVFPDTPLPFDQLKMVNADVKYTVKELETGAQALRNVKLALKLDNGRLALKPVQAQVQGGSIEGDVTLDASKSKSQPAIAINLQAKELKLGDFKQLKETLSGGSTRVTVHLKGAGDSVREIMAGLNGETVVDVGEATLSDDTINLIGGDIFVKLLGALTPAKAENTTAALECAVVKFDVQDGIAKTDKGIVVKTEKMILVGNGAIDLKTERIELQIASRGRSAVGVDAGDLTQAVGLGGTLASPKPIVDVKGAAKTGATVGAAVMTLGTSYLAQKVLESRIKDKHPCLTALGKAPSDRGSGTERDKR